MVGEEHLGVKFEMLQLVNLNAHVFHNAHPSDGLYELSLFEFVRRTGHDVNLDSSTRSSDQALHDDCILVALILEKEGFFNVVDELRDALAAVTTTPDQMAMFVPLEVLSCPIRFEAFDDFGYFVSVRSNDGVVPG